MQHLSPEDLARVVDEAPTEAEALHLGACDHCRSELAALREQTAELGRLPKLTAPAAMWPALRARLSAEGLVSRPAGRKSGWLQAAAALTLFLAGGATGAAVWATAGARTVPVAGSPALIATPVEAAEAVRATEAAYLEALTRYAQVSGSDQAVDPVNRLAALEGIVLTTRAALEEAPADPVINGYHLAALSQREAMLRQISARSDHGWF